VIRRLVPIGIVAAFSAVLVSYLAYTWQLSQEMRANAAVFSRIYFQVVQAVTSAEGMTAEGEFNLILQLLDLGIPVVQTDLDGTPTLVRNLPFEAELDDPVALERVQRYVERLDGENPPLVDAERNFVVHYGHPLYLQRLRWIPWLQAILLLGVVGTGVWMIRTSSRSERERIWTAMARESAHQMGTPLSSLAGWLELLESTVPPEAVRPDGIRIFAEMEDDVRRLEKVSRRFELIGRRPALRPVSLHEVVGRVGRYFRARMPSMREQVRLEVGVRESIQELSRRSGGSRRPDRGNLAGRARGDGKPPVRGQRPRCRSSCPDPCLRCRCDDQAGRLGCRALPGATDLRSGSQGIRGP